MSSQITVKVEDFKRNLRFFISYTAIYDDRPSIFRCICNLKCRKRVRHTKDTILGLLGQACELCPLYFFSATAVMSIKVIYDKLECNKMCVVYGIYGNGDLGIAATSLNARNQRLDVRL